MGERHQTVGHRRFGRLPVVVPVIGRAAQFGDTALHGMVWNIGGGGLLAKFPVQIVMGSVVDLVLQTRTGPLGRQRAGRVDRAAGHPDRPRHCLPRTTRGRLRLGSLPR